MIWKRMMNTLSGQFCCLCFRSKRKPNLLTHCRDASTTRKLCSCHPVCLPTWGGACGKECVPGVHGAPNQPVSCLGCLGAGSCHTRVSTPANPLLPELISLATGAPIAICRFIFSTSGGLGSWNLNLPTAFSLLEVAGIVSLRRKRVHVAIALLQESG